ncbi:MAG TPA: hypothetical protein VK400_18255 [Pyrinomonadaceae bacterium]|nr:hypothetical protein [Pyrinomonadaceae bacterium]
MMNELNEFWANSIGEAISRARAQGQHDLADYLSLKSTNDEIRAASCRWLFEALLEIAHEEMRGGLPLKIENENPYRFEMNQATMVGSLLEFTHGIRRLSAEAGWTRTPQDGFMRGGALACARLAHFGQAKHNAELILVRPSAADSAPQWLAVDRAGVRTPFDSNNLREHFRIFLG